MQLIIITFTFDFPRNIFFECCQTSMYVVTGTLYDFLEICYVSIHIQATCASKGFITMLSRIC